MMVIMIASLYSPGSKLRSHEVLSMGAAVTLHIQPDPTPWSGKTVTTLLSMEKFGNQPLVGFEPASANKW